MSKNGFKKFFAPYSPPFIEQGDGITPALGDDVRVCPFLPIIRMNQDWRGQYAKGDTGIVIEAGEPIGIVTIGTKKWIVPASPTDKLTAHSLRHTFGTVQAEAGINAFVLKNLMRHADIRSTERYTKMAIKGGDMINPMGLLGKVLGRGVTGGLQLEAPETPNSEGVQVIQLQPPKS